MKSISEKKTQNSLNFGLVWSKGRKHTIEKTCQPYAYIGLIKNIEWDTFDHVPD